MVVSVDQYLNSSYHPDREFVDGTLEERGTPTITHGLLRLLLTLHLGSFRRQFRFALFTKVRTQIVERARYRVPDIIICPQPVLLAKIVTSTPWAVIEVLSPDDSVPEQLPRFRDYDQIGVRHMILLDPEALVAKRFENGVLVPTRLTSRELPTGTLPFDTEVLFQQLVEERRAIAEAL